MGGGGQYFVNSVPPPPPQSLGGPHPYVPPHMSGVLCFWLVLALWLWVLAVGAPITWPGRRLHENLSPARGPRVVSLHHPQREVPRWHREARGLTQARAAAGGWGGGGCVGGKRGTRPHQCPVERGVGRHDTVQCSAPCALCPYP